MASRRIALRWLGWFGWRAAKWLAVPALAAAAFIGWWQSGGRIEPSASPPVALPASAAPVASAAASQPAVAIRDITVIDEAASAPGISNDPGAVRLRLDAVDTEEPSSQAPGAQAQSASSPDNMGRERER